MNREKLLKICEKSVKSCPLLDFVLTNGGGGKILKRFCHHRMNVHLNARGPYLKILAFWQIPFHWLMQTTQSFAIWLQRLSVFFPFILSSLACECVCVCLMFVLFFASQTATVFCRMHNEFFEYSVVEREKKKSEKRRLRWWWWRW